MRDFHDIAWAARPADKNAADLWLALAFLAQWRLDGPEGGHGNAPIVGRCAVSLEELANAARVSPRTASQGVRTLAELGLVRAAPVMSGGRRMGTVYTLLPVRPSPAPFQPNR
ncbi:MAG: hypothetical protein IJU98_07595 [Synergistaceae bacterium]|nr:hypothetical protein [Synergistaceae bacterium]